MTSHVTGAISFECYHVRFDQTQEKLAEAVALRLELAQSRAQTQVTLSKLNVVMVALRRTTTLSAQSAAVNVRWDETAVTEYGLTIARSRHVKRPAPHTPSDLRASSRSRAITLRWDMVMRRCMYEVEVAAGQPEQWQRMANIGSTARTRVTIPNLQPGVLYWFRVRAQNNGEFSGWSSPLGVRVV